MNSRADGPCDALSGQVAVLVVSCDNYADLWQPFFTLFRRFWPDCPFQVYLLSNHRLCADPGVTAIPVGDDISWSDNVRSALNHIEQDYVFMFIEDLFLVGQVPTGRIVELFRWIVETKANYVRLIPAPGPDLPHDETVGIVSAGTIYRTSTVLSVWKKEVLADLLVPGENAWEFEIKGTPRSDKFDKFFSTWERLLPVENGVIKGKWQRHVLRKLKALNVGVALDQRPVMALLGTAIFSLVLCRSRLLGLLPSRYRRSIRSAIAKTCC